MQIIRNAVPIAEKILGKNTLSNGQTCRLLTYLIRVKHDHGTLFYNVMTKSIISISIEETALIDTLPGTFTQEYQEMADLWFVVPENNDDMALSDGLKNVVMALDSGSHPKSLTSYTIYTTTDCNARCFYCFEAGTRRYSMTEQTAHDVAAFIIAHCKGESVHLRWFGGEPLFNSAVIDIICSDLNQADIEYKSSMLSNGYLFDEQLISHAVELWCLKKVQITLDGTEEQYNRRKAYVHVEDNPYQRVLRNIELLDQAGVNTNIRLNAEWENIEDISILCDELCKRFSGCQHIQVYISPIFEKYGPHPAKYSGDDRMIFYKQVDQLQQFLLDKGLQEISSLKHCLHYRQCLADNEKCTDILPDGRLGCCDVCTDKEIYGSIYSEVYDEAKIAEWQETYPPIKECESCFAYPDCIRLIRCPSSHSECEERIRNNMKINMQRSLLSTYQRHLKKMQGDNVI